MAVPAVRVIPVAVALVLATTGAGCDRTSPLATPPDTTSTTPVARVRLAADSATLAVGQSTVLSAAAVDAAGNAMAAAITWSTEDARIATVTPQGTATGVAAGTVRVWAHTPRDSAFVHVTVRPPSPSGVAASVRIAPESVTVDVGRAVIFTFTVLDGEGHPVTGRAVQVRSTNPAVLRVYSDGHAFADAFGETDVIATVDGHADTAHVLVPLRVSRMELLPEVGSVAFGQRVQLTPSFRDGLGRGIPGSVSSWTSSAPDVIAVSPDGVVTGLGIGSATITAAGPDGKSATARLTVRQPMALASVSVGVQHACGLTAAGAVWCWGDGWRGTLGNGASGETAMSAFPVPVSGGHVFAQLSSGDVHSCALTAAGEAYCWGSNKYGALGIGSIGEDAVPIPQRVAGGLTFARISSGGSHTCALTAAGAAWCWGYNVGGRLGDGTTTHRGAPVAVRQPAGVVFASIHAAGTHTCALTAEGAAYCWGNNHVGQLGDGTHVDRPTPVPVTGGLAFASLSANGNSCGLTTAGAAYCWGSNQYGSIGDGAAGMSITAPVPTRVQGGIAFAQIAAGSGFNCARTAEGRAYCWGDNSGGQLGDGEAILPWRATPTPVAGGLTFTWLSSGTLASCGLTTSGTAYCWGSNYRGVLGNGSTSGWSASPVPVVLP